MQGCSAGWLGPRGRAARHPKVQGPSPPVPLARLSRPCPCAFPRACLGVPGSCVCTAWHRGISGTHQGCSSAQAVGAMAMAQRGQFSSGNKEHWCLIQSHSRSCPVLVSPSPIPACACRGAGQSSVAPRLQLTTETSLQGTVPLEMGRGCAVPPAQFQAEVAVGNIDAGIDLGTAKIPPPQGCTSKQQTRSSHQSKSAGIHLQWGVNEGGRDVGSPDPDPLQPALTSEHSYPCPKVQGCPLLLLLG